MTKPPAQNLIIAKCPCCGGTHLIEPPTLAENLIDLAKVILYPRSQIICMGPTSDEKMARAKLALDLYRRGIKNGLVLRGIIENWDAARIVRELY